MPAAEHEVIIINFFVFRGGFRERLDYGFFRVVDQSHDMRQFKRCILADCDTRRDPVKHGCFRCADLSFGTLMKIIFFKIDLTDDPATHIPVGLSTLHIDHRVFVFPEKSVSEVLVHGTVDLRNTHLRLGKVYLRQNQVECGRNSGDLCLDPAPVGGITCELVARNDGPFFSVGLIEIRQKNIRRAKSVLHHITPFMGSMSGEPRKPVFRIFGICASHAMPAERNQKRHQISPDCAVGPRSCPSARL